MISVIYIEKINSIAHQSMKISKWIISLIFLIVNIVAYLKSLTVISATSIIILFLLLLHFLYHLLERIVMSNCKKCLLTDSRSTVICDHTVDNGIECD